MRMVRRFGTVILTTSMLALPALGAVALHRLSAFAWLTIDWSDPLTWIARTPPEDIVAAILRHLGLIGCCWLSTASVVYTAGRLARLPGIVEALGPITPKFVRSIADRVVIGAVTLSSLGVSPAPAMADRLHPPIPDPIEIRATVDEVRIDPPAAALVRDDYLPYGSVAPRNAPVPSETPDHVPVCSPLGQQTCASKPWGVRAVDATRHQETIEVQSGDSLWLIASRHLAKELGRQPSQEELRAHWHATIAANLPTLSSGNPDLIHPGEIITLPLARKA